MLNNNDRSFCLERSQNLAGLVAFQKVLQLTQAKTNSREIWLKLGHNLFLVGDYDHSGQFGVWETSGKGTNRIKTNYHPDCWEFVSNWCRNNDGGIFFIPTQPIGYPLKDYIKFSDDIAAELDDGTQTEQWSKIERFIKLSGLKPAYIIHSGSKSYHPHWKATEHLLIEQTIYLRRLLCIALNSDSAVTNPHQPMRMAGFYRREKRKEQTLNYWSNCKYSYDDLIAGFRAYFTACGISFPGHISDERWRLWKRLGNEVLTVPEAELYPQSQAIEFPAVCTTYTGEIPLTQCLSQANQEALSGVTSDRNMTGYALACDLFGCQLWLNNNGYRCDGDAYQLFIGYCLNCSNGNGWNQFEWDAIWRSALGSNPTPAKGNEGLSKFIHWYRWSHDPEYKQAAVKQWKQSQKSSNKPISREEWQLKFGSRPLFEKIKGNLKRYKQQTRKRLSAWGFSTEQVKGYQQALTNPNYYKPSYRLDTWQDTGKWTFDASDPGTGKSFDAGRIDLAQFDCDRAFYITSDPRNPSTSTLDNWDYLDGRHGGLTKDVRGKLRVAKADDSKIVRANCGRTKTITALKNASVNNADSAELICQGCNWYEACKGGHVFGYLGSRQEALQKYSIRTHPSSLPHPDNYEEYSNSLLIWDEWTSILTNTQQIKVTQADLTKLAALLLLEAPQVLNQLQPLLTILGRLFKAKPPTRFGWNHQALIQKFPALSQELDRTAILKAIEPDLSVLNPTAEYGEDINDLPTSVRKKFNDSDTKTAQYIAENVLKQWLMPFLDILQGEVGYFTLSQATLIITIPDPHLVNIARAVKKNIFLDATGSIEELALLLGIKISEIDYIAVEPNSGAKIRYIQVAGMGRLGQHRGDYQQQQVEAVIKQLLKDNHDTGVIRFKKYATDSDFRWFIESRGVNDAENLNTLILDGIPCPNLASLAAAFTCMYGRQTEDGIQEIKYPIDLTNSLTKDINPYFAMKVSSDEQFNQFVRRRILANLHQGWGRLRANRRKGEDLTVYILGDYPLDVPVELVKAVNITPDAATKMEKLEMALKGAVAELHSESKKITQQAIAKITGYSQGYISRFRELLQTLIESFSSKSNNSVLPDDEVVWLATEYLPLATTEDLASEIFNFSGVFDLWDWIRLWESAPASTQINILKRLVLALPAKDLKELSQISANLQ